MKYKLIYGSALMMCGTDRNLASLVKMMFLHLIDFKTFYTLYFQCALQR